MGYRHNPALTGRAKALRKDMTKEERRLWYDYLRNYPVRFLRQKVIDDYIVDFYCAKAGLVIELDGSQHYEAADILRDQIRTSCLERHDLLVLRIPNNAVNENLRGVCAYIDAVVQYRLSKKARSV